MLNVLDLFSGIGGFSLGLERTGYFQTVGFCEIDPFCQKVLKKHWPTVPIHNDICELKGNEYGTTVDVITGGVPCQPWSTCGREKRTSDSRHLWPEMLRIIREARPSFVIVENVAGFVRVGLDLVQLDLENEGYSSRAFILPASAYGAKHRRDRLFLVAYSGSCLQGTQQERQREMLGRRQDLVAHGQERQLARRLPGQGRLVETVGRTTDGVPDGLDEGLKALGNAILPQIPEQIGRAILADVYGIK